jgi:hypothetical protein
LSDDRTSARLFPVEDVAVREATTVSKIVVFSWATIDFYVAGAVANSVT